MEKTTSINKRFSKDYRLPINLYSEPYFSYFTELYESQFNIHKKLLWLNEVLTNCSESDDFFKIGNEISENIKNCIKNSCAYEKLNNVDMNKNFVSQEILKNENIYQQKNIGKEFISIDLNKANFNVFGLFGLKEELMINSYEDLIKKFTDYNYFIQSKMLRQVIFGDLNPKRQQKLQKYVINNLASLLGKNEYDIYSCNSDELIISHKKNSLNKEEVKNILANSPNEFKFFKIESFCIEKIKDSDFYLKKSLKENNEEHVEFKSVPNYLYAQVFKYFHDLPINDYDLMFYHENMLAQFKEPYFKIDNKFKIRL